MRILTAFGLILGTSSALGAQAATITHSTEFTTEGSFFGQFLYEASFPLFDPTLGRLTSITVGGTTEYRLSITYDASAMSSGLHHLVSALDAARVEFLSEDAAIPFLLGAQDTVARSIEPGEVGAVSTPIITLVDAYSPPEPESLFDSFTGPGMGQFFLLGSLSRYRECNSGGSCGTADFQSYVTYRPSITYGYAVPEPGTWALMILGFGMTGAIARRRRKHAPPSSPARNAHWHDVTTSAA